MYYLQTIRINLSNYDNEEIISRNTGISDFCSDMKLYTWK